MLKKEVELQKVKYEIYKLNALKQFHLLRKLLALINLNADTKDFTNDLVNNLFIKIGALSEQDANNLLSDILQGVRRVDNEQKLSIFEKNKLMYEDIELMDMLTLCKEVLVFNFENFTNINQLTDIKA